MIATWHVLRLAQPTEAAPWRPAEATYWQAGPSAGTRIAMTDPGYWSFLGTWPDEDTALAAEAALSARATAAEAWHVHLRPVSGHGDVTLVGGATPFADLPRAAAVDGPVAIITVGMVPRDPVTLQTFFGAAFGPVARSLAAEPGCLAQSNQRAVEIDGLAAFTFSVWDELRSATAWAYRAGPHRAMLDRNASEVLMEASGFWRFAVLGSYGAVDGCDPLGAALTGARAEP